MHTKATLIFFILLSLFSCTTETVEEVILPFEQQNISVNEKIKQAITLDYLQENGFPDSSFQYLTQFYSERDFSPKWVNDSMLTSIGIQIKEKLELPFSFALPAKRIPHYTTTNYIQDELMLTLSVAQMVYDLDSGVIDFENKLVKEKHFIPTERLNKITFNNQEDIRLQFLQFGPQDSSYQLIGKGLVEMIDSIILDTSIFNIVSIKYDTLDAESKTSNALISKGYLNNTTNDSSTFSNALGKFQLDNALKPDAVIGKYTSFALNESTFHKVERILLAMDKIRSRKKRPSRYLRINIPEYKLRYFINDSLKSEHNIVVGKTDHQTPELTAKLRKIVVYPYWNVPYSISSKEILPHLKRDPVYLEKHNYVLLRKDSIVDPYGVNWKKIRQNAFPYRVRQEPGPRNSLGIIKFDFYNTESVYFHDTPSKSLFGVDVRAYSHGCMRTQNPIDLAKVILERDEYRNKINEMTPDSLDSLYSLDTIANLEIKLLKPIPIFIEYQSVVREGERMKIYIDIYGRDEEYLKLIRE